MSATFPDPQPEYGRPQGRSPSINITRDQVTLDDIVLPGLWIEKNGVTIRPAGPHSINRVTITFFASNITVDDETLPQVRVLPDGSSDA